MDKTKTRDITFRIFAVVIALVLWMYVTSVQNPEIQTEITGIPVALTNVDVLSQAGLIMIGDSIDKSIRLTVKGRSSDVLALKSQDFKAEANLGNGYRVKGTNSILVEIKEWPKDIEIPNQPVYISVELDELVEKNFPVAVQVNGQPKEGYTSLAAVVKPKEVTLRGAAKFIGRVNSVAAKVDIKDADSDIVTSLPVQILDKDGKTVVDVKCNPETVDLTIPINRAKDVPINIRQSGNLPEGVFMIGMSVNPTRIRITGDERVVDRIREIDTLPVNFDDINTSTTRSVSLNIPDGVILLDDIDVVSVNITVEKTITKNFNIQVNYINLPDGLKADLLTNTIGVTLSGRESIINKYIAADITAVIDLVDAPSEDGEYDYTPQVAYPQDLELIGIDPEVIKVKISKKQG